MENKKYICRHCGGERTRTPSGQLVCKPCSVIRAFKWKNKSVKTSDSPHPTRHPEYTVWINIKQRCYNQTNPDYQRYGGRGISICDEWKNSFYKFVEDMGPRPSRRHSVEREDVNGNYEPGNCHWATPKEQNRNTTRTRWVVVGGEKMSLSDAAEKLGITYQTAWYRHRTSIDNDMLVSYDGKQISLQELSEITNIELIVLRHRAILSNRVEFLTASFRNVPTYEYKNVRYTVVELSLLCEVDSSALFDRIYRKGMSVEEAMGAS